MPVQAAQWTEFLSCPICLNEFNAGGHKPISLGCSHTVCKTCLHKLHRKACPFDQTAISIDIELLPVNRALLLLVGAQVPESQSVCLGSTEDTQHYDVCRTCVEELALYLKPITGGKGVVSPSASALSRPMQRKLVTLVNCQLVEEEGRVRALRAARSLGERTITELILQHQNPQQLSANLWAAVRARGCQFLGPAMQEDALKLVLLALEDGSALSRKVLVLFVVQKLEARFPQASKTSIGHVVQLLYRASCFKVTKRDEDSSLMQLKEEFRTYEALRREHDAQIVHIAMEAGLRISPEQWSSLLYGDLVHKSHMQSIIDKLQSPESFAKSVQELTIVLQRTGDPANLNILRAPLELLAGIDQNLDAAVPSWEELESVMLAVKVVVHGLVEFIQNFSKKSHETFQSQPNSKYKTSMCRDLRQQGTCPRGVNCTFAHTQDELEKYRMRNKKVGSGTRPSLLSKTGAVKSSAVDACPGEQEGGASESSSPTRLVPRGGEQEQEELMKELADGFPATSQDLKTGSPPKSPASGPPADASLLLKPASVPQRGHHEVTYFPEQRSAYDLPSCPSGNFFPAPLSNPHKPYLPRFPRSSPASDSSAPPPLAPPYPDSPLPSRLGMSPYPPSPSYPPLPHSHPHGHGVYAPVYDSRRLWRPQLYHRQDGRSNSLPLEVLHSSIYHPPLRERFNSLDSAYCSASSRRAALHREAYGRAALGSEDFYSLRQEQWSHQHHGSGRAAQHSPVFTVDLCPEDGECTAKHWLHVSEPYRRVKEEDPIIPFGEGPIISKWGAISRSSRTDHHTTEPVQATATHSRTTTTTLINFKDYSSQVGQGECRWSPCVFEPTRSGFLESEQKRSSFSTAGKRAAEFLARDGAESGPDRDIELELCALHMEDSEPPGIQSEASLGPRCENHLSSVFSDGAGSSRTAQSLSEHMDAHLLKKMAFRKSLSPGGLNAGGLTVGGLVMKTGSLRPPGDAAGPSPGPEMILNGS
ncbi:roquin-2 isoform X3 [Pangasianodon hypophthalmus]|uniref:roquin-2 isoform X3 n=1 Tax=Pangasianodon hypophthalmus TaxID=310915 RepID=UPI002307CA59|nr:roquin-2 isoform X3 [Pangasianodon hypophthalmus]